MIIGFFVFAVSLLLSGQYLPWTSFQQEMGAALGLLIVAAAALRQSAPAVGWPRAACWVLAAALIPLVQIFTGKLLYRGDGVLAAMYLAGFALAIAAGYQLARAALETFLDQLATTLLAVSLISVGIALGQWLQVESPLPQIFVAEIWPGQRPGANFGQPNHLGTFLFLGLVSAGWLYEHKRMQARWLVCCAALMGLGMVLTQSRTQWLTVILLIAWAAVARRRARISIHPLAVFAFAACFFLVTAAWDSVALALDAAQTRQLTDAGASHVRLLLWRSAFEAIQERFWLGYGWGEVMAAMSDVSSSAPSIRAMSEYSHNVVLDMLLWNGVPVGAGIVIATSWWIARRFAQCHDAASAYMLAAIGAVVVHALLEFPHAYIYFLLPVGLLVGAVEARAAASAAVAVPRSLHAAMLASLAAVASWVAVEYMRIDADHREMRLSYMGIEPRKAPGQTAEVILLDHMRAFIVAAREPVQTNVSADARRDMQRAVRRFPHPPLLLRYAIISGLNGDADEARDALARLCHFHSVRQCTAAKAEWTQLAGAHAVLAGVPLP